MSMTMMMMIFFIVFFFHLNQFFWFTLSLAGFDPSTRPFLISLAFFMIFFIMFSMVE